jgi:hypothetical protein
MSHHYISLETAREELIARSGLRACVEKQWANAGLEFPLSIPEGVYYAAFARQLASFRFEDAQFILMSEKAGLQPSWLPYTADRFVTRSALKRSYILPMMAERYGRNGGLVVKRARLIADVNDCSGKKLNEIRTITSCTLPAWHKDRLHSAYGSAHVFDESAYAPTWSKLPTKERYEAFLSFFVAHMVLFEDYHGGESGNELDGFTTTVFEPAFERVRERFGVSPLVVPVPWKPEFAYYPESELLGSWRSVPFLNE